jgi:hypothetical protein
LIAHLDAPQLQFIDETGVHLAMTRLDGRAPQGQRVRETAPQHDGPHVTMVGALGIHGIEAVMTVEGATDTEMFLASLEHVLTPTLQPGDIVVMDNLRAHKVDGVQAALERRGARLLS